MTALGDLPLTAPIPPSAVDPKFVPTGTVLDWWRPASSVAVPPGWELGDGHSIGSHDFGGGAVAAPDTRGRHSVGAKLTVNADGTGGVADGNGSSPGDAFANAPGIGGVGGSNATRDLGHAHTANDHTHPMPHSHAFAGVDHQHGNAQKNALMQGGSGSSEFHWIGTATYGAVASGYGMAYTSGGPSAGSTGGASALGMSGATLEAGGSIAAVDVRPAHVGLLRLVKAKAAQTAVGAESVRTNLGDLPLAAQVPSYGLDATVLPLGTVIDWWRPTTAVAVPGDWEIADGGNVVVANHDFPSALGTITKPNLIGRQSHGANVATADGTASAANATPATGAPGIAGIGGANAGRDLRHHHTMNSHTHDLQNHQHGATPPAHAHALSDAWIGVATGLGGTGIYAWETAGSNITYGVDRDLTFFSGGPSTNVTGAVAPATNVQLGATQDTRNAHVGMLKLVRVRARGSTAAVAGRNLGNAPLTGRLPAGNIVAQVLPIGAIMDWWRPAGSGFALPTGWEVADGHTVTDHDFGGGSIAVPNLIGKSTMGARLTVNSDGSGGAADGAASAVGDAYANAPGIGGAGGANSVRDLSHSHTVLGHSHSAVHNHGGGSPDHLHWLGHSYNQWGNGAQNVSIMAYDSTGRQSTFTDAAGVGLSEFSGTSDPVQSVTAGTTTATVNADMRPAHVGFLKLVKVKNT